MTSLHTWLGHLGLIPFLALALAPLFELKEATLWLGTYAALIISFLAGTLWQHSVQQAARPIALASNIIMILSWLTLLLIEQFGAFLALSLLLWLLWRIEKPLLCFPSPYFTLRQRLTIVAALSLFFAEWIRFV
ncbi:MAG: DUF3429 domain-containing protein [Thiotrichales bacterium]|nr:DUF3429 domain-containing protein [Thiotrichales bacterium]